MRKNFRTPVLGLLAAGALTFGGGLSASAASVEPALLAGNPSCEGAQKIEPVVSGTYGGVSIDVHGSTFDFFTDGDTVVSDVIVKGGPNANWYHYDPAVNEDFGLHSPINPKNGRPYGLSHLCFTVGDEKNPEPDPK